MIGPSALVANLLVALPVSYVGPKREQIGVNRTWFITGLALLALGWMAILLR
jgi:hypothetical protein